MREGIENDSGLLAIGDEAAVGKGFSQEVRELGCGRNIIHLYGACLGSFADEMVLNFYVLGAGM